MDEDDKEFEDGSRMTIMGHDDFSSYNSDGQSKDLAQQEMDPSLWGYLTEDIEDRILSWLPFEAFARMRTVCKRWNGILKSSTFLHLYRSVPAPSHPCFLMFDAKDWSMCWLFNPSIHRWHSFPFDFQPIASKFPCAAAGGLLCFCGVSSYPNLYVCNPITRKWREIPPMENKRFPNLVGMVVDESSKSYKLIVAGDYHGENTTSTEVFDSVNSSWVTTEGEIPLVHLTPRNSYYMGFIFWLTGDPFGLIAFNLEQAEWITIQAPMPDNLISPHLVGCTNRLLMVGGIKKHIAPKSIRIWELDMRSMLWKTVAIMPPSLCSKFLKDSLTGDFMCIGQNNLICLTSYKCSQALMYDVLKKVWQWLPAYPFLSVVDIYRLHIGLPFTPRWDIGVF
ncbi:unnamed protein product [Calypogeia fissa]